MCFYRSIIKNVCPSNGHQCSLVLHGEVKDGNHDLGSVACQMQALGHNRLQTFTQFYRQVVGTFLGFVKSGLYGVVLHLELLQDARTLLICLVGQRLTCTDFVGFASHDGKNGRNTGSFGLEVAKQRSQISQSTLLAQPFGKLQQSFIGIGTEQVGELLHLDTGCIGKGFGRCVHLHQDVLISRCGRFFTKHVLVHGSGKAQDVGL